MQTIQARKLLFEEAELADLNIGVMVQDRVATLSKISPDMVSAVSAELAIGG